MRAGGAYIRDPETGETRRVSPPLQHHPEGSGARDAHGRLVAAPAAETPAPVPEPQPEPVSGRRGRGDPGTMLPAPEPEEG